MTSAVGRRRLLLLWCVALAAALLLRTVPLTAARPYIAYVDEGNFLHPVVRLLREGGWEPREYLYPQLPIMAVTGAVRLYEPLYDAVHERGLKSQLPESVEVYDDLEPFDLLVIARGLNVALGLAIVILTGLFAGRLAGPEAGAAAALVTALTPALVLRGSIASVDSYATLCVLVCLFLADRTRTSKRPGLLSAAAGAAAGFAFASKYPAVAVITAFVATALLEPLGWREKTRRIGLATVGLILGAALAMPAMISHPREILEAIRRQGAAYGQIASPPLWRQALLRAEWTLPYDRPELGALFLALAAAGVVMALRDRRLSATVWGWCAFAAIALALYGRQVFQPFRNLLPLVPPACIAVALLFTRLRQLLRRPIWADAAFLAWLLLAFGLPLSAYANERARLNDTRVQAIDWLVAHARGGDDVLFVHELGFRRQELARLPAHATIRWWDEVETTAEQMRPRFLVAGYLWRPGFGPIDALVSGRVSREYELRLRVGKKATNGRWIWGENNQLVYVLERRNAPAAPP